MRRTPTTCAGHCATESTWWRCPLSAAPKDIELVHQVMDEENRRVPVIAKIEKPQAVDNLNEIIDAFDAFMVARGDLGVELPLEEVPLVQKRSSPLPAAGRSR